MITQKHKAEKFKQLHQQPGCFIIPNSWDIGTAKILEFLGFQALATTSAGLAFSMGKPDCEGMLSLDTVLENAHQINENTDLPVSADLENGYGNSPEEVYKTIIKAGELGLVGASIEDYRGIEENPIYDFNLSVDRIAAAVEAKNSFDFPFMLIARSENFVHGINDLDDTLKRFEAFEKAGADVLYAPDLPDLESIQTVTNTVSIPVNVMIGPALTVKELEEAGVKRISLGSLLSKAVFGEFIRAGKELLNQGTASFGERAAGFSELGDIFRKR